MNQIKELGLDHVQVRHWRRTVRSHIALGHKLQGNIGQPSIPEATYPAALNFEVPPMLARRGSSP